MIMGTGSIGVVFALLWHFRHRVMITMMQICVMNVRSISMKSLCAYWSIAVVEACLEAYVRRTGTCSDVGGMGRRRWLRVTDAQQVHTRATRHPAAFCACEKPR